MSTDTAIRSFRIDIPQAVLDDLTDRLARTRWPDVLSGVDWSYGVPSDYLKDLVEYWRTSYDWRAVESRLNEFPQFITEIDGTNVHFVQVRSPEPNALPLVLTHGWPGSFVEFIDLVGPLTDPRSHGAAGVPAFDVVIPSIPGYGFSGPTRQTGWDTRRVASAWAQLMCRLGYQRYGAQGGDWGSAISRHLSALDAEHVVGVHVNMFTTPPPDDSDELALLSEQERRRLGSGERYMRELSGYMWIQATRPQTLAYALTDSPVGQLAWIVEKFKEWTDSGDLPEGAVDRDRILTNVMMYWLTATAGSSARLYKENRDGSRRVSCRWEWRCFRVISPNRYGHSPSVPTRILCTGPNSTGAGTSRRWNNPSYSSTTSGLSSPATRSSAGEGQRHVASLSRDYLCG